MPVLQRLCRSVAQSFGRTGSIECKAVLETCHIVPGETSVFFFANRRHFIGPDFHHCTGNVLKLKVPVPGFGFRHVFGQVLSAVLQRHHRWRRATGQRQQGRCSQGQAQCLDVYDQPPVRLKQRHQPEAVTAPVWRLVPPGGRKFYCWGEFRTAPPFILFRLHHAAWNWYLYA